MIGLMNGMAHGHANRPGLHPQLAKLGADKNGQVKLEDIQDTKLGRYISENQEAMDANTDGMITKGEFRAFKTGGNASNFQESGGGLTVILASMEPEPIAPGDTTSGDGTEPVAADGGTDPMADGGTDPAEGDAAAVEGDAAPTEEGDAAAPDGDVAPTDEGAAAVVEGDTVPAEADAAPSEDPTPTDEVTTLETDPIPVVDTSDAETASQMLDSILQSMEEANQEPTEDMTV